MTKNATKKALFMSCLSLLLCMSMLVGTTFAWFTDTASTGVNQIMSGNLDIVLEYKDSEGQWKEVDESTLLFKEGALYEPGYAEVAYLRVSNAGNLALTYRLAVDVANEKPGINVYGDPFMLSDHLQFGVIRQTAEIEPFASRAEAQAAVADDSTKLKTYMDEADLLPGEEFYLALVVYMPTTVENEANHKPGAENAPSIDLSVNLFATQADRESDSYGPDYDEDAFQYDGPLGDYVETVPDAAEPEKITKIIIHNAAGLMAYAEKFGTDETKDITTVEIAADIDLTGYKWKPMSTWDPENSSVLTIDGQGHTISNMNVQGGADIGFFGSTARNITVKDLTFDGANVTTSASRAGVVFGGQYSNVILDNVDVKNSTVKTTAEKGIRIGGLIGQSFLHDGAALTISNCDIDNVTVSGYHNVAGLVGTLYNYDGLTDKWTLTSNTVTNSTFTVTSGNEKYGSAFAVEGANYPHTYDESNAYFTGNTQSGNRLVLPIKISTVEELQAMSDSASAYYYLANDIDLAGVEFATIKNFAGTFDGQGYTISNMTTNLFGTVSGTVKNLNVENVTILNATKNGANSFIGTVATGGLVDNCKVSGVDIKWTAEVNAKDTTDGFGGVIGGVQAGATVQNCEFSDITVTSNGKTKRTGAVFSSITGTVKGCVFSNVNFTVADTDTLEGWVTSHGGGLACDVNGGAVVEDCVINNMQVNVYEAAGQLGGIFGKAHISGQTAPITLKDITVNGLTMNVGNASESMKNVAGFIGQPDSRRNDVRVTIDNCHINGLDMTLVSSKQGESAAAGFISGLCGGVDVTNCSVSGKIDATNAAVNVGGFVGDAGGYGTIEQNFTNCSTNVEITVKDGIGGGFIAVDGTLKNAAATINFNNCQATGTVTVVDGGTGTAGEFVGKTIE